MGRYRRPANAARVFGPDAAAKAARIFGPGKILPIRESGATTKYYKAITARPFETAKVETKFQPIRREFNVGGTQFMVETRLGGIRRAFPISPTTGSPVFVSHELEKKLLNLLNHLPSKQKRNLQADHDRALQAARNRAESGK